MKKIFKILLICTLLFSFTGCGKVATLKNGEDAILTLNDGGISANDLYNELKDTYGVSALMELIDKTILNAKYESDDEEKDYIKQQVNSVKQMASQQGTTFESIIQSYYGCENQSEFEELVQLSYRREKAVVDYLKKDIKDSDVEKYYKENIFGDIRAKHILIKVDTLDGMTSEEQEAKDKEAKNKALEVIKKLDNGEKFDDLVKEYTDDEDTKKDNGDLGWFNTDKMVSEFTDAAFALKKGEYTKTPVKTTYGYHIILKTDEKDKPELKNVKTDIQEALVEEKLADNNVTYYRTLEKVRDEAGLKFEDDELRKQYESYMYNLIINAQKS